IRWRGVGWRGRCRGACALDVACRLAFATLRCSQFSPQADQFVAVFFSLCSERPSFSGPPLQLLAQLGHLRALLPEPFDFAAEARVGKMLNPDWYCSSRDQRGAHSDLNFR